MFQLAQGTLNLTGKNKLQQLIAHPDNGRDARHHYQFVLQLKNNGGAPYTLTAADMLSLFRKTINDTWNLQFGEVVKDKVDQGLIFDELRQQFVAMTYRDFLVRTADSPAAAIGILGTYTAACSYAVTVNNGQTVTIVLDVPRSFIVERPNSANITRWCPGATQVKQLYFEFNCQLSTFTANAGNLVCTGGTYRVMADVIDGPDVWVKCVRMFKNPSTSLKIPGPAEGGKLIALFEQTSAAVGTALANTFSLQRTQDEDIHTDVFPQDVIAEMATQLDPLGALVDLNALVTCLYRAGPEATLDRLPSCKQFLLSFTKQDLQSFATAWVYAPAVEKNDVDQIGKNATEAQTAPKGGQVMLTNASRTPGVSAATDGIRLMNPHEPGYSSASGYLARAHIPPQLSIPSPIAAIAKNAIAAQANHPAGDDVAAGQALAVASQVPSASHPTRGILAPVVANIVATIHPSGGKAANGSLMSAIAVAHR